MFTYVTTVLPQIHVDFTQNLDAESCFIAICESSVEGTFTHVFKTKADALKNICQDVRIEMSCLIEEGYDPKLCIGKDYMELCVPDRDIHFMWEITPIDL